MKHIYVISPHLESYSIALGWMVKKKKKRSPVKIKSKEAPRHKPLTLTYPEAYMFASRVGHVIAIFVVVIIVSLVGASWRGRVLHGSKLGAPLVVFIVCVVHDLKEGEAGKGKRGGIRDALHSTGITCLYTVSGLLDLFCCVLSHYSVPKIFMNTCYDSLVTHTMIL